MEPGLRHSMMNHIINVIYNILHKMASKNKHQEDNAIENLNSHLTSAGEKIANNKKIIFWIVGIILVVGCFVLSYLFIYRNPKINKSFEALNKVEQAAMGNDSIAAAQYKEVADRYGSTDAGKIAALSAAESYYNIGNYQEAIKYLDKFDTSDEVLAANALVLEGDCYVNLKKYDKALEYYEKAIRKANANPQIVPRVLLKEANIYDEQKKYDKALECYKAIKEQYSNFELGNGVSIDAYIERENARLGK